MRVARAAILAAACCGPLATACAAAPAAALVRPAAPGPAAHRLARFPGSATPGRAVAARGSAASQCSTAAAAGRALWPGRVSFSRVPPAPFDVAVTSGGRWAFVSLGTSVGVYRLHGAARPRLVRQIPLRAALGEAITPGGRYLLVAVAQGAAVINIRRAEHAVRGAVTGTLSVPRAEGPIEVTLSRKGTFAFVSVEGSDALAVFNLHRALTRGFGRADYAGSVPLGVAVVGSALSPDGRWLYVTSELAGQVRPPGTGPDTGTLSVISVRRAEADPARSVAATVTAGCEPVRVVTSASGRIVWVTARESDELLGFSAARLSSRPSRALVARVRVGAEPVGLALADHGRRIVVADSDRYRVPGATASLAVVNVPAALAGHRALAGYLPSGLFPRQLRLEPGGRVLLVTNYASGQLERVRLGHLPRPSPLHRLPPARPHPVVVTSRGTSPRGCDIEGVGAGPGPAARAAQPAPAARGARCAW